MASDSTPLCCLVHSPPSKEHLKLVSSELDAEVQKMRRIESQAVEYANAEAAAAAAERASNFERMRATESAYVELARTLTLTAPQHAPPLLECPTEQTPR